MCACARTQVRASSIAVRLPGLAGDDIPLWLPIDAKFTHEDHDRLLGAQEGGIAEDVEKRR